MNQPPYTTHQVAELLGVTVTSIINWVKSGRLQAFKTPGGHRRITREALSAFREEYDYPSEVSSTDTPSTEELRILVVDSERDFGEMVAEFLSLEEPWIVQVASEPIEAAYLSGRMQPQLVLLDVAMPRWDPVDFVAMLRKYQPDVKVVCTAGFVDQRTQMIAAKMGAERILEKPIKLDVLLKAFRSLKA